MDVCPCQTSALLPGKLPSEFLDCFFSLLLDSISALFIGGGWRAGGSGPNAGRRSAAETVDASLLCLKFSSPTLEEEPNSASCAAKRQLASRLFCVLRCSGCFCPPDCWFEAASPEFVGQLKLSVYLQPAVTVFWLHLALITLMLRSNRQLFALLESKLHCSLMISCVITVWIKNRCS